MQSKGEATERVLTQGCWGGGVAHRESSGVPSVAPPPPPCTPLFPLVHRLGSRVSGTAQVYHRHHLALQRSRHGPARRGGCFKEQASSPLRTDGRSGTTWLETNRFKPGCSRRPATTTAATPSSGTLRREEPGTAGKGVMEPVCCSHTELSRTAHPHSPHEEGVT